MSAATPPRRSAARARLHAAGRARARLRPRRARRASSRTRVTIPYADIPGFRVGTVAGHAGALSLGTLDGVPVACFQGRSHVYEGIEASAVTTPIRTLRLLGAEILVLTNAAGSLRPEAGPGSLVALTDHINMQGFNPLVGLNDEEVGPRFPSLSRGLRPGAARRVCTAPPTSSARRSTTASTSRSAARASRRPPRSARSARSAPTSSA